MALGKTVGELERYLTASELTEWFAYARIEPFGDDRADWRMAFQMALQASSSKRRYSPNDFMPFQSKRGPVEEDQSFADMVGVLRAAEAQAKAAE